MIGAGGSCKSEQAQISPQAECLAGDGRGFVKAQGWGGGTHLLFRSGERTRLLGKAQECEVGSDALTSLLVLHSGSKDPVFFLALHLVAAHQVTGGEGVVCVRWGLVCLFLSGLGVTPEGTRRHNRLLLPNPGEHRVSLICGSGRVSSIVASSVSGVRLITATSVSSLFRP